MIDEGSLGTPGIFYSIMRILMQASVRDYLLHEERSKSSDEIYRSLHEVGFIHIPLNLLKFYFLDIRSNL